MVVSKHRFAWFLGAFAVAPGVLAQALVTSFESPADIQPPAFERALANVSLTASGATDGLSAANVVFPPSTRLAWVRMNLPTPLNLNSFAGYAMDVTNNESRTVTVTVFFRDGSGRSRNIDGTMAPGETARFAVIGNPSHALGASHEMLYLPNPYPGTRPFRSLTFPFTLSDVRGIGIVMRPREQSVSLTIDHVRILPLVDLPRFHTGITDRYGQFSHRADWPGKVKSDADIVRQHEEETLWMSQTSDSPEFDDHGGWALGPKLTATGFFRTARVRGKWWFVTPEGRLFFSTGPTSARTDAPVTRTHRREFLFQWLPPAGDPLEEHWAADPQFRKTMNFYTANVERKLGPNWVNPWLDMTKSRLRRWGFNSLGWGFDWRLIGTSRLPYTMAVTTTGGPGPAIYGGTVFYAMPDPWNPEYRATVRERFERFVSRASGDKEVLGWFVDNELPWSDRSDRTDETRLARDIMARSGADQPAKAAFVALLQQRYGTIARLNEAWGRSFASWLDVQRPVALSMPLSPAIDRDCRDFVFQFAVRYFSVIRSEFKRAAPNHLYLGCRFDVWTPEVLRAAELFQDAISFNLYVGDLATPTTRYTGGFDFMKRLKKPVMIGEMHFSGTDRGLYGMGLFPGQLAESMSPQFYPTQADRAAGYIRFLQSAFGIPQVIGVHWHRYVDDPVSGRAGGGLNANIGFVSITDTPYWDFILPVRDFNMSLYRTRNNWPLP